MASKKTRPALHTTAADTTAAVETFMRTLDHPFKKEIAAIRLSILGVAGTIAEGIKWNATSFRTGEYFATMNLREKKGIGANIAAGLQLTDKDRCLNVMPLFHIHGLVGALLSTMMAGGSVVCSPGFDAEKFFHWLEEYRPIWYRAVPTMHQAILAHAKAHPRAIDGYSLRFIRSCSAPLPASVARDLEEIFHVPVVEAYGMTEAAHQIASNPLPPKPRRIHSVGLPTGTEVAVVDDQRHLLARGEVGEIVIRGATVIAAYANRAAVQEESFTDGWFRTGDQGYIDILCAQPRGVAHGVVFDRRLLISRRT